MYSGRASVVSKVTASVVLTRNGRTVEVSRGKSWRRVSDVDLLGVDQADQVPPAGRDDARDALGCGRPTSHRDVLFRLASSRRKYTLLLKLGLSALALALSP